MANLNNHRNLHIQNDQTGSGSVFARKNTLNTYLQGDAGISDFTAYDARVNSLGGNDNQFFTAGDAGDFYGNLDLPPNAIEIADDIAIVATSDHDQDLMYVNQSMPDVAYLLAYREVTSSHDFSSFGRWRPLNTVVIPFSQYTRYGEMNDPKGNPDTSTDFIDQLPTSAQPDYISYRYELAWQGTNKFYVDCHYDNLTKATGEEYPLAGQANRPLELDRKWASFEGSALADPTYRPQGKYSCNFGFKYDHQGVGGIDHYKNVAALSDDGYITTNPFIGMIVDHDVQFTGAFDIDAFTGSTRETLSDTRFGQLADRTSWGNQGADVGASVYDKVDNGGEGLVIALPGDVKGPQGEAMQYGLIRMSLTKSESAPDSETKFIRKGKIRECGKVDVYQRRRGTITDITGNLVTIAGPSGNREILGNGDIIKITSALHEETGNNSLHPLNGLKYVKKIGDSTYELYEDENFNNSTNMAALRGLSGITWTHFGSTRENEGTGSWRLYDTLFSPNGMNGYEELVKAKGLTNKMTVDEIMNFSEMGALNPTAADGNDLQFLTDAASSGRHLYDGYRFGHSIDIKKQDNKNYYWLAIGEPGKTEPILHNNIVDEDLSTYGLSLRDADKSERAYYSKYENYAMYAAGYSTDMETQPIGWHELLERSSPDEYEVLASSEQPSGYETGVIGEGDYSYETPMSDPSDDGAPTDGPPMEYSDYGPDETGTGDSEDTMSDYGGNTEGSEGSEGAVEGGEFDSSATAPEVGDSDGETKQREPIAAAAEEIDNTDYQLRHYHTPIYRPKHEPHGRVHLYKIVMSGSSISEIQSVGTIDASTYNPLVCQAPKFCMDYGTKEIRGYASETDYSSEVTTLNGSDFNPLFFNDFTSLYWYKAMVKTAQEHSYFSRYFQFHPQQDKTSAYRGSPALSCVGIHATFNGNRATRFRDFTPMSYNRYDEEGNIIEGGWGVQSPVQKYGPYLIPNGPYLGSNNDWSDGAGSVWQNMSAPNRYGTLDDYHLPNAQCVSYIRPNDRQLTLKIVYRRRHTNDLGYLRNVKAWLTDRTEQYILKYGAEGGAEPFNSLQPPAFFGGRYLWNQKQEDIYKREAVFDEESLRAAAERPPSSPSRDSGPPLEDYIHYEILSSGYCFLDEFGKSVAIEISDDDEESFPKLAIGNNVVNEIGDVSYTATKQLKKYKSYIENENSKYEPTNWSGRDDKLLEWIDKHRAGNTNGAGVGTVHMFNIAETIPMENSASFKAFKTNLSQYYHKIPKSPFQFNAPLPSLNYRVDFGIDTDIDDRLAGGYGPGIYTAQTATPYGQADANFRIIVPDTRWNERPRGSNKLIRKGLWPKIDGNLWQDAINRVGDADITSNQLINQDPVYLTRYDYNFASSLVWKDGELFCGDRDRILVYSSKGTTKDIKYTFKIQNMNTSRSPWDKIDASEADDGTRPLLFEDVVSMSYGFPDDVQWLPYLNKLTGKVLGNRKDVLDYGAWGYLAGEDGMLAYNFYEPESRNQAAFTVGQLSRYQPTGYVNYQRFNLTPAGQNYVDEYEPNFLGNVWHFNFNPASLSEANLTKTLDVDNPTNKPAAGIHTLRLWWGNGPFFTPVDESRAQAAILKAMADMPVHALHSTGFGILLGREIDDPRVLNQGTIRFPFKKRSPSFLTAGTARTTLDPKQETASSVGRFVDWLKTDTAARAFFGAIDFNAQGWPYFNPDWDYYSPVGRRLNYSVAYRREEVLKRHSNHPNRDDKTWDWSLGRWMFVPALEEGEVNPNIDWVEASSFYFAQGRRVHRHYQAITKAASSLKWRMRDRGDDECITIKYPQYTLKEVNAEGYNALESRSSRNPRYYPITPPSKVLTEPTQQYLSEKPIHFRVDEDLLVVHKVLTYNEWGSEIYVENDIFTPLKYQNLNERGLQVFKKDSYGNYRDIQIIRSLAQRNADEESYLPSGTEGPFAIYGTSKTTEHSMGISGGAKGWYFPLYTDAALAAEHAANGKISWVDGDLKLIEAEINEEARTRSIHSHTFEEFPDISFWMPSAFNYHAASQNRITVGDRTSRKTYESYPPIVESIKSDGISIPSTSLPVKRLRDFDPEIIESIREGRGINFFNNTQSSYHTEITSFDVFKGKIIITTAENGVALFTASHRTPTPLVPVESQVQRIKPYFGYEEKFEYESYDVDGRTEKVDLYDYSSKPSDVYRIYQNVEDSTDGHNTFLYAFNIPLDSAKGNVVRVVESINIELEAENVAAEIYGKNVFGLSSLSHELPSVKVYERDPRETITSKGNIKFGMDPDADDLFHGAAWITGAYDSGYRVTPQSWTQSPNGTYVGSFSVHPKRLITGSIIKDGKPEERGGGGLFTYSDSSEISYVGANKNVRATLLLGISSAFLNNRFDTDTFGEGIPDDITYRLNYPYSSSLINRRRRADYIDTGTVAYSGKANKPHNFSNNFRIRSTTVTYRDYDLARIRPFDCDFYKIKEFDDVSAGSIIRIGNSESAAYFDKENEILVGTHTDSLQVIDSHNTQIWKYIPDLGRGMPMGGQGGRSYSLGGSLYSTEYRGDTGDAWRQSGGTVLPIYLQRMEAYEASPPMPFRSAMGADFSIPSNWAQIGQQSAGNIYGGGVLGKVGSTLAYTFDPPSRSLNTSLTKGLSFRSFDVHKPQGLSLHLPSYPMESGKAVLSGRGHTSISSGIITHISGVVGFAGGMNLQANPTPTTGNFDLSFYKPKGFECGTFGLYGPRIGGALNSGVSTLVFPGGSGVEKGMNLKLSNDPEIEILSLNINVPIPVTGSLNLTAPSGHGYWNSIPCVDGNLMLMGAPSGTNTRPLHIGRWPSHEAMNLSTSGPKVVSPTGVDHKPSGMALNMNTRPNNSGTLYTYGVSPVSSDTSLYIGRQTGAVGAPLFMLQPKRLPFIDPQSPPTYEPDSEDSIQIPTLFISGSFVPTADTLDQNYGHQKKLRLPIGAFDRSTKSEPIVAKTNTNSIERGRYTNQVTAFGFRRKNSVGSTMTTYSGPYAYNFYENETMREAFDSNGRYLAIATNTTFGNPTIQVFKIANKDTAVWEFEFGGLITALNNEGYALSYGTKFYFKSLKISPGHKIAASLRAKEPDGKLRDLVIVLDPEHVDITDTFEEVEDICALDPRVITTYSTEVREGWTLNKAFFSEVWYSGDHYTKTINNVVGSSLEWKGEDLYYDRQNAEYGGIYSRSDSDSFASETLQVDFADTNDGIGYNRNSNNLPDGTKVGFGHKVKIVDDLMFVSAPMLDPYISENTLGAINISNPVGAVYIFAHDGSSWSYTDTVYSGGYTKDDISGKFSCGYDLHLFGYDIDYDRDSKVLAISEPAKTKLYKFHVTDSGSARYMNSYEGTGRMFGSFVSTLANSLFTSILGLAGTILDPVYNFAFVYNRNHTVEEVRNYIPFSSTIKSVSETITGVRILDFNGTKKLFVARDFEATHGANGSESISLQKFSTLDFLSQNGTLYISGPGSSTRVMSIANIRGEGALNNNLGLTTGPFGVRTSLASEDASSWDTYIPSGLAMSIEGESGTNQMPLHIRTKEEDTNPLFLQTIESWPSKTASLYTAPPYPCSGDASAYIYGSLIDKDNENLYIRGQGAGVKDMLSETFMIMKQVDIYPDSGNGNLYMQGIATGVGSHTSDTFMFLGAGDYGPASGDTFLRLENDDPYPASGALPFAINIGSTGVANSGANLIMSGPSTVPADPPVGRGIEKNTATLFTMSTADASGALALNMPRKGIGGGEDFVSNVSLFVDNSYIALDANVYVSGGFVSSSNINLAIPSGVGLPSGNPPLFVRGYSD